MPMEDDCSDCCCQDTKDEDLVLHVTNGVRRRVVTGETLAGHKQQDRARIRRLGNRCCDVQNVRLNFS